MRNKSIGLAAFVYNLRCKFNILYMDLSQEYEFYYILLTTQNDESNNGIISSLEF